MNEPEFGSRIRDTLNFGLTPDTPTLQRLRLARESALRRQRKARPLVKFARDLGAAIADRRHRGLSGLVLIGLCVIAGIVITTY
jgi:hypothetical protein